MGRKGTQLPFSPSVFPPRAGQGRKLFTYLLLGLVERSVGSERPRRPVELGKVAASSDAYASINPTMQPGTTPPVLVDDS